MAIITIYIVRSMGREAGDVVKTSGSGGIEASWRGCWVVMYRSLGPEAEMQTNHNQHDRSGQARRGSINMVE
jgi:hypothetical protein